MGNKKKILRFSHIATLFLIALALACVLWIYLSLTNNVEETSDQNLPEVKINTELYQKIQSDSNYGTRVSTDELGFGRVNPFSNYKAESVTTEEGEATENDSEDSQ